MPSASIKAIVACTIFAIAAVVGFLFFPQGAESLFLEGYFVILLINTFFSIRAFSGITPQNFLQSLFDVVLALLYIAIAFSFGSLLLFCLFTFALFALANAKYAHLSRLIPQKEFVRHKMFINSLGALLSAGTFAIAGFGYPLLAAWTLLCIYALANIYLLAINPMYRMK